MAYIEPKCDKNGKVNRYRLVCSAGYNYCGKQIRKCKMWYPEKGVTSPKLMKYQAMAAAYEFEKELQEGYEINKNPKFADYAKYVMELKLRNGLSPTTVERYKSILKRVNEAIGHLRVQEIRPQQLNEFYMELGGMGIREESNHAVPKRALKKRIDALRLPKYKVAEMCNVSNTTLTAAMRGKTIGTTCAKKISKAMGYDLDELFKIETRREPLSDKTILEHHRLISSIFSQAEKEMIITYNPASRASPPKVRKHKADYFQPEEMEDIIEALELAPLKWKTMTYLLIDTGCRRGELMGLQWKHINFDQNTMMIEQALLYTKDEGIFVGPTKNGQPRAVCLSPESMELLHKWHTEQLRIRLHNAKKWQDTGFIFTQDDGSPMHPDSITQWLGRFSDENGLPHIHPHAFRHTVASTLIANGVDLVTTAAELGHTDATTTAMIYAHQIAKARAAAAGIRAGVFATLRKAE